MINAKIFRLSYAILLAITVFFCIGTLVPASALTAENTGDFTVDVAPEDADKVRFEEGVLYISCDADVSMADGISATTQRIVIDGDAEVTLSGVVINAEDGPAIRIEPGVKATLSLADGKTNEVTGGANYAGVEVGYQSNGEGEPTLADLTIDGNGDLKATGGSNSAGIGGSYNNTGDRKTSVYYGNITIESGNIEARSPGSGAGIGSAGNNGGSSGSFKVDNNGWGKITINGGNITAESPSRGAGIGGGNHVDSGVIEINGGTIERAAGGSAGIGSGLGSSNYGGEAEKGNGYYFADITINGGHIKEAAGGWLAAGIGGGYECDAIITINGGTIDKATGGNGNEGSYYQGAPGIGAGYQGNVKFTMTGGTIGEATGGWSAPGIGYGAGIQDADGKKRHPDCETVSAEDSLIRITGGTISLAQGGLYGAGIGSGNGCPVCNIEITGGDIRAVGYSDPEDLKAGGAGIGSGAGAASGLKYSRDTDENISITGGKVLAIGGWGASGIGSGATNPYADTITIDANKTDLQAYADGTKFAIDTRILSEDGKETTSRTEGRTVSDGYILQGTFVHNYEGEGSDPDQSPEGLASIRITNDGTGDSKELTEMGNLTGYRSFATDVPSAGVYTVYTDDEAIGEGGGRYFSELPTDRYDKKEAEKKGKLVQYTVSGGKISDNFYLFPVKSVVVGKKVQAEGQLEEKLNATAYFGICFKNAAGETEFVRNDDGSIWRQKIEIVNGVPQGKAYFVNLDDRKYDVREITEDGTDSPAGQKYGSLTLKRITTQHGETFGLDEGAAHALDIQTSIEGTKRKITVTDTSAEGQGSLTLSLFNGEELIDGTSQKLVDGTASWTVPATDKSGKEIEYRLGDTSNNATIDSKNWSDEVKVINSYGKDDPDDPDDPDKPDDPGKPDDPDKPVPPDPDKDGKVKTGDESGLGTYAAILAGAVILFTGAGVYIVRKRREEDREQGEE